MFSLGNLVSLQSILDTAAKAILPKWCHFSSQNFLETWVPFVEKASVLTVARGAQHYQACLTFQCHHLLLSLFLCKLASLLFLPHRGPVPKLCSHCVLCMVCPSPRCPHGSLTSLFRCHLLGRPFLTALLKRTLHFFNCDVWCCCLHDLLYSCSYHLSSPLAPAVIWITDPQTHAYV